MELKFCVLAIFLCSCLQCLPVHSEEEFPVCSDGDLNICCPKNDSCPDRYVLVERTGVCNNSNDSMSENMTTSTPVDLNNTTDANFTEIKVCERCDEKCLKCDTNNTTNCTVCYIEHDGACYTVCPSGTILSDERTVNGSRLCDKVEVEGFPIGAVIGAIAGGLVAVAIAVVVVICVVRRRRSSCGGQRRGGNNDSKNKHLVKKQKNEEETAGARVSNKPKGYMNMQAKLPGQQEIMFQADALGRYSRDPTFPRKPQETTVDNSDDLEDYMNHPMINLSKKTDLTTVDSHGLEDMVEREELDKLGEAPKPPDPSATTSAKPNKSGPKRTKKKKEKLPEQPTGPSEDYLDMSIKDNAEQHDVAHSSSEVALEDYENVRFSDASGRKAVAPPPQSAVTSEAVKLEIYEKSNADIPKDSLDDLDDYENTKDLKLDTPVASKDAKDEKVDAEDDLEEYENVKALEDYENIDFKFIQGRKAKNK